MRKAGAVSARCEDAAPVTTHRPTCPERQSDLCQGAKRKTSKTALRRLLQRTDRANQWSFVRASHVPFDAEVGASYAPIAHRLARGGGFHLCELASTATRVVWAGEFHPGPNPKPDVQVSKHPAFQTVLIVGTLQHSGARRRNPLRLVIRSIRSCTRPSYLLMGKSGVSDALCSRCCWG